jgi:hypothetical protein
MMKKCADFNIHLPFSRGYSGCCNPGFAIAITAEIRKDQSK